MEAQARGIVSESWTFEHAATMTDAHMKSQEEAAFEAAFSNYSTQPRTARTFEPVAPLTPWYLEPESGDPNPTVKKAGIQYADEEASETLQ